MFMQCPATFTVLACGHLLVLFCSSDFTLVFEHLGSVKGSVEARRSFLNDIIREAGRFKRRQLVEQLKDWGERTLSKPEVQTTAS